MLFKSFKIILVGISTATRPLIQARVWIFTASAMLTHRNYHCICLPLFGNVYNILFLHRFPRGFLFCTSIKLLFTGEWKLKQNDNHALLNGSAKVTKVFKVPSYSIYEITNLDTLMETAFVQKWHCDIFLRYSSSIDCFIHCT